MQDHASYSQTFMSLKVVSTWTNPSKFSLILKQSFRFEHALRRSTLHRSLGQGEWEETKYLRGSIGLSLGEDKRTKSWLIETPARAAAKGILGKSYFRSVEAQSSLRGVVKREGGQPAGAVLHQQEKTNALHKLQMGLCFRSRGVFLRSGNH